MTFPVFAKTAENQRQKAPKHAVSQDQAPKRTERHKGITVLAGRSTHRMTIRKALQKMWPVGLQRQGGSKIAGTAAIAFSIPLKRKKSKLCHTLALK